MEEYDLTATLDDGAVALKVPSPKYPNGRKYVFKSPSGTVGLWLQNLIQFGQRAALGDTPDAADVGKLVLDDDEEDDMYKRVMGDTLGVMLKDDVPWTSVQYVFSLLLAKWGANQAITSTIENLAGEAVAQPNRAARRASGTSSSPKAGSKSSRTSSATKARTAGRGSTRSSATSARRATATG